MATNETIADPCFFEPPPLTNIRFWLVTVFGSAISIVSIFNNVLLFYLFSTRKHHRTTHNMYLMLLAFFDIFVSLAYCLLMSVNVASDYFISPVLLRIWFIYMVPMITISHIAMTTSSFLIVAASFERYCLTLNKSILPLVQKHRMLIAAFAIILGVISKGSMYFEFEIHTNPECEGTMAYTSMRYSEFVFSTSYNTIWRFWYRNFVTIFAPFFILAYLNTRIVKALTIHTKFTVCQLAGNAILEHAKRKGIFFDPVQRKANARAATRTLVMVVCCYLISNIINVILTIWEHVDKDALLDTYVEIYAIAVDLVSLLTTLACACRLPIYVICQVQIRNEVKEICRSIFQEFKGSDYKISETDDTCRKEGEMSEEAKQTLLSPEVWNTELEKKKKNLAESHGGALETLL